MTRMLKTKAFERWLKAQGELILRYRQVEKSDKLAEYQQLKAIVESSEFQENKQNFRKTLLGKLRWGATAERQQEKRLAMLAKDLEILLFESYKEEVIAELESYMTVWSDEFDGVAISDDWATGMLYPVKELCSNHSHTSEQQAYTQGKNTRIEGSVLSLMTKKEKCTVPSWHPTKGMHMHTFAYTSDIWHTAKAVLPVTGVLQAKVRLAGKAKHVLSLATATSSVFVPVLHTEPVVKGYVIHTVAWDEKEIVAYVNNVEVARTKNPFVGEQLHLILRSYLPENQKAGSGQMDVDWIRVYSK